MSMYAELRQLINDSETLVVPDAYDGISAKIIETAGFNAVQCSGYSFSIARKYKREALVSLEENISATHTIVKSVSVPVFADGEDGYGCNEIFFNNIERFYSTGIAGINIEDQNLWNDYCTEKLLPVTESVERIKMIRREFPDLVINARTDAINVFEDRKEGMKTAIERANIYYEAGADLCFPTGVVTKEEIRLLNEEIQGPVSITAGLPYNMHNFTINDCRELGIARVSLPTAMIFTSIKSQLDILQAIQANGSFTEIEKKFITMDKLNELLTD